ncbi:hypothetical protein BDZ85DRAFT_191358 [Elsinoe ampelina]|uniref:BZIP domain-containing protein n=1 Tax=Elsinoe ampelina TaxID=302913 RepID=A0A6A6GLX6_9PEZI|nr:hypothetical protein BDZ85DRAFT_191358 [Elsinoe ampelina]
MNSAALSPRSEQKWDHHSHAIDINRKTSFASTNPFRDDYYRNSISASAPSSSSAHVHHQPGWNLDHASGTASPLTFDPYQTSGDDFDVTDYGASIGEASGAVHPGHQISVPAGFVSIDQHVDGQTVHTPVSPYSNPDHMAMTAQEYPNRAALPRHMRPGSRPPRPGPNRAISDGVRKKNTRIDIPADRNLNNIEELIEQAHDDDEIKELKAQRRLLRNREAALASRQRKKQHTEDLEVKEQRYMKQINSLKGEIADLAHRHGNMENEFRQLHEKHANALHLLEARDMEKEELTMKYTEDTGNLRRKIAYLQQQLDNPHGNEYMMNTNTNFNDFTSDMNALSVNNQPWMAGNAGQFTTEPEQARPVMGQQDIKPAKTETDPPIASGVLFMILLCGAFVASKGNSKPFIPRLPEEVRVASNTVLDSLLKDSRADILTGNMQPPAIHPPQQLQNMPHPQQMRNMQQAHNPWQQHVPQQDNRQTLYRSLTMPTNQQEAEQLFQLTPSEYNSLTSADNYAAYHPQQTMAPRRNLAQTLATVREESISKAPPAEVYTRSLLWDQIPADVVKQFKELVRESKAAEQGGDSGGQMRDHKHEQTDAHHWGFSLNN